MTTGWVPYDGVYPLREEGWLMAPDSVMEGVELQEGDVGEITPDGARLLHKAGTPEAEAFYATSHEVKPLKPIDDLEDDAPDVPNDEVTVETKTTVSPSSENDDDQPSEKENPNG